MAIEITSESHKSTRSKFGLPPSPPRDEGGAQCKGCANNCKLWNGSTGYCGLVKNIDGRLVRLGGTPDRGVLEWYYDPLPTNCVSSWFCPGCTGRGYPIYSYSQGPELGYYNLAVFYGSCSFDCLFCQNWHYRSLSAKASPTISSKDLALKIKERRVSCICFFGGDPSTQMPHSLETCRIASEIARDSGRILRLCWETNGHFTREAAMSAYEYALKSGGNIKFDIKAWDESLNIALCGVSNRSALDNFKSLGKLYGKRPDPPPLSASTLLIPGYIDAEEVEMIADFISSVDRTIPYTLLAFYGCYAMGDLPTTSRSLAIECKQAALKHLDHVSIGNIHLLS
ncbi:MAG: radical SAM protein [Candidatus Methanomethyliaceae archaeon]|nr:radical SAM protein [Candidatus Methanomethyliaceae archaeon]